MVNLLLTLVPAWKVFIIAFLFSCSIGAFHLRQVLNELGKPKVKRKKPHRLSKKIVDAMDKQGRTWAAQEKKKQDAKDAREKASNDKAYYKSRVRKYANQGIFNPGDIPKEHWLPSPRTDGKPRHNTNE